MDPVPWREAWHTALYAAGRGFYVTRGGPAAHFTTATHGVTGAVLAEALLRLWSRRHRGGPPAVVVDVGAGRGELATHVADLLGARAGVVAVDVVDRPEGLDPRIEWVRAAGGALLPDALEGLSGALVVAHEWLDVVPCTVAGVDDRGQLREVLVDPATGDEHLGGGLSGEDLDWVTAHWPDARPGERVEVGRARDAAWAELVGRVESGVLVAVDYGHLAADRPRSGTLVGYRSGTLVPPVPDGSCDVTAHVAMDSLWADGLASQRDLLRDLGLRGERPDHALAQSDPLAYLRALERASAEAELIRPGGLGDFWWAVKHVGAADVP
ncbi:SAM-dependent methyltransferase [Intrasporangium sp.]|uniref:SAM-dependent methyltransferase n=1 Tax=Intrasporangium sp. TaxID=1925024 RepID=UPI00293A5ED4|nr:SAM-dependent methyltransferase [Intrasporangium sp.]MDV3220157.1 SAM-dependent methyltransferase [Intrasporangium sp.]